MNKEEIKKKFGEVQEILDSLQDTGATCLFIGHEGNHFVMGGSPARIGAQMLFAMARYPIVRDIVMTCAERFGTMEAEVLEQARKVEMTHLIEVNSGNKEDMV